MPVLRWTSVVLICLSLAACGSSHNSTSVAALPLSQSGPASSSNAWPAALPRDTVQPGETTDAAGHVVPPVRGVRAAGVQSVFASGGETFLKSGSVLSINKASRLVAGLPGQRQVSYAMYRLPLGGEQPGAVGVDVNIRSGDSTYYVAVADYAAGRWQWHGPYSANYIRLVKAAGQLDSANYLSSLGDLFVCVAAFDGNIADVVGVGADPASAGDPALPAAPTAYTLTPVPGGLLLDWKVASATDFAGYLVFWSDAAFSAPSDAGVHQFNYAVDGRRLLLPLPATPAFVALQTVDLAGNVSPLTAVLNKTPIAGTFLPLTVTTSVPSGLPNTVITLSVAGASNYDFDLDGDGIFEVTGSTSSTAHAVTSAVGMVRPAVRGHNTGSSATALAGVSLLIAPNTPPVVSADADKLTGATPLTVNFTGTAFDAEDQPNQMTYAWDFNGDGTFDAATNSLVVQHTYTRAGTYNVVFKATDTQGATSTAGVTLQIAKGPNIPPTASFVYSPQQAIQPMVLSYNFDANSSFDPDGDPLTVRWDFDGTGFGSSFAQSQLQNHAYAGIGTYTATLKADDGFGGQNSASQTVYVPSISSCFDGQPGNFTRQSPVVGAQTNQVKWLYRTGSVVLSTPAIGPLGTIYCSGADNKVYALTDNGTTAPTVKWTFTAGDAMNSSPAVTADGTVIVGCSDHNVYALVDNGTPVPDIKWTFPTGDVVVGSPTIGPDGTIYVASDDDFIYALTDNGAPVPHVKWSYQTGSAIESTPAVGQDGTVYIGSFDRKLYALTDNGTPTPDVKWSFVTTGAFVSSPAIGPDGTVYIGCFDNSIYALTDNGTTVPDVKWSYATLGGIFSSPAVGADGTVYVGSEDGSVYALKDNGTATPDLKWSYATGNQILESSPTIGKDNTVYIGSSDKKMYALIDNGSLTPTVKWTCITGGIVNGSLIIGPDGRVYGASEDEVLYAFGS